MKKTSILLLGFLALFSSCETDFEINAPWKDITIVYGLLNQNDSIHYIKINKVFLGEDNALNMALIRDSSEYGNISAVIERWKNGTKIDIEQGKSYYTLMDTTITNKDTILSNGDPAVFYAPNQTVFYFVEPNLDEDSEYKLIITKTGKVVTATTPIINKGVWCGTTDCNPSDNPNMKISFYIIGNNSYGSLIVKWKSVKDGRRYQLTMRFKYDEKNVDTGVITQKSLDWLFTTDSRVDYLKGNIGISKEINGEEFYKFVASKLTPVSSSNNIERSNVTFDFIIDVAGEEFNTYMEVNEPSTGIVQEKPEYTNIKNDKGEDEIGIFSCRYYEIRGGKKLNAESEDWLQDPDSPTAGLGFK